MDNTAKLKLKINNQTIPDVTEIKTYSDLNDAITACISWILSDSFDQAK